MSVFRSIAISLIFASLPLAASAEPDPVTTDLVPLMPVVKTLEADLKLNAAQERLMVSVFLCQGEKFSNLFRIRGRVYFPF